MTTCAWETWEPWESFTLTLGDLGALGDFHIDSVIATYFNEMQGQK